MSRRPSEGASSVIPHDPSHHSLRFKKKPTPKYANQGLIF
jgi:hypothetical protein